MAEAACGTEELVLPSRLDELERVDEASLRCARQAGLDEGRSTEVAIAVVEAVTNAIMHGNGQDDSKVVRVRFACVPGEIKVMVHDEGGGFDVSCLPDPTDPDRCMRCSGRGIYIMRHVMDKVEFDMSSGTTVTMTKGVRSPSKPPA
jgi:serine/threonine-protein kinase RsbW